jgi:hypothetical protein
VIDRDEMNNALDRALEEVHNEYCNSCKEPFVKNSGKYTELTTIVKIYKIWYCDECWKNEN